MRPRTHPSTPIIEARHVGRYIAYHAFLHICSYMLEEEGKKEEEETIDSTAWIVSPRLPFVPGNDSSKEGMDARQRLSTGVAPNGCCCCCVSLPSMSIFAFIHASLVSLATSFHLYAFFSIFPLPVLACDTLLRPASLSGPIMAAGFCDDDNHDGSLCVWTGLFFFPAVVSLNGK